MERGKSGVQSTHAAVEKALDILTEFIPHNREIGTTELAGKMGLHKSTANRLLHTLGKKGFLSQNKASKKFRLGPTILTLGVALKKSLSANLVSIAKPHMDALRDRLKETISLEIFSGSNTILAHLSEGPARVSVAGNIGDILSVNAAAGAKAILSFSPESVRKEILQQTFPKLTPNTITEPDKIRQDWKDIAARGFSLDREEHDIGITAIGVPIFDSSGKPAAALSVAGATGKIKIDPGNETIQALRETASVVSNELYHTAEE